MLHNNTTSTAKFVKNLPIFQSNFTNWHEEINATTQYVECNIVDEPQVNNLRKDYGCDKNFGENKTYSCKNLKKSAVNILDDHHAMIKTKSQNISKIKPNATSEISSNQTKYTNRDEYMMYNEITGSSQPIIKIHELARSESVDEIKTKSDSSRSTTINQVKDYEIVGENLTTDNTSATIIANRYLIGDLISSGSYSNVFKCIDMFTRKKCVIKEFLDNDYNFRSETIRELTVLSTLRNSPHIVGVHSIISAVDIGDLSTRFYAVLNYHTKTLHDFIYENADYPVTRRELGEIFYRDIARGLAYMHACGIAHCDLKPANILITSTHNAVIADFSLALFIGHQHMQSCDRGHKCLECTSRILGSQIQTLGYRAPEILFEKENFDGFAADVWSFGCVAAEIYYGYPLFYAYGSNLDYLKSVIRELGPVDTSLDYMQMESEFEPETDSKPQEYQPVRSPIPNHGNSPSKGYLKISDAKYQLVMESRDYYENYKNAIDSLLISKENLEIKLEQINTKVQRPRVPKIADSDLRNVIEECLSYNPCSRPAMFVIASYFESCYGSNYIAGKYHPLDSVEFNTKVPKAISKRMNSDIIGLTALGNMHQKSWEFFLKTSSRERHINWLINICDGFFRRECIYTIMRIHDMFFKELTKFVDIRAHPIVLPTVASFSRAQLYEYAKMGSYAIGTILYEELEVDCDKLAGDSLDKFILAKFMIFMITTLKFDFGICERIFMDICGASKTEQFNNFAKTGQNLLNYVGYSPYDSAKLYL